MKDELQAAWNLLPVLLMSLSRASSKTETACQALLGTMLCLQQ